MSNNWFIVCEGKEYGPYTSQQMVQFVDTGHLRPVDLVRRGDMTAPR